MNQLNKFHSKGRIKTIVKSAPNELWHNIFDQEITNSIIRHPFVDQFTWIKPNCENVNVEEPLIQQIIGPKFYLFENIFPNSILSIPFIQNSIIDNNGVFISLPSLPIESSCALSIINKQAKQLNEEKSKLMAIIRTPNTLFKNVINVDKFMKQPPHMKKTNHVSFHKIELSEKSYWNDKSENMNKISGNFQGINFNSECLGSIDILNAHTEVDQFFFNPLLNNSKDIFSNNSQISDIYACVCCNSGNKIPKDLCYCKAIRKSKNPPFQPSLKSLSYKVKGSGNNQFYFSLQQQFCSSLFTKADFLCYFDNDKLLNIETEARLLKNLKTILCINGSPNVKITPINVKFISERINNKLIDEKGCGSKGLNVITGSDPSSKEYLSDMSIFIDLNALATLILTLDSEQISNTQIFEQIIEYFDILIHQNLFSDKKNSINPFYFWDLRFGQSIVSDNAHKICKILKSVPFKEAPSKAVKIIGLLRPTILQRFIWFVASQVAAGTYLWSLFHLKGVESSPISINYKPHFIDENKNSVNDLYLLIFRINEEISILCISVVNYNDANL
ncbi:hypothetical protein CmeUKMEL1_00880 [Cryptosporidium meleagridis]|uniref:Uncharacterized protein n=1 Tax=Cryptosporidium meleagridis TaxID=93969 RepID=A0A2P4YWG7_9CRYT|nr:hypothetical protein CmeUKMEL1_00880 [Cryptosporidium meleagridis]